MAEDINLEAENLDRTLTDKFKVRLEEANRYADARENRINQRQGARLKRVIFDVTPDLSENRTVNYKTMDPIHMPGQIHVYGSTNSRAFQLSNVRLISRTVREATKNMNIVWALRGWTMPYFGMSGTLSDFQRQRRQEGQQRRDYSSREAAVDALGQELLGKPPAVLFLTAYSNATNVQQDNGARTKRAIPTNIDHIPVVITNLSIPYPSDVDYIPTLDGQPFPRIMVLDIQLTETQAPKDLERFTLQEYRRGILQGF